MTLYSDKISYNNVEQVTLKGKNFLQIQLIYKLKINFLGPCGEANKQSYLFVMPFMNRSTLLLYCTYVQLQLVVCILRGP